MPSYSTDEIARGFVDQADKHGAKVATKELAALVLEQRLQSRVERILEDIKLEYQRKHGQVEATAITAYPLSAEMKKLLVDKIKQKINAKTVVLHEEIDRSLLGGVKLTAPDMELDLSLRSKLKSMQRGSI